MQDLRKPRWGSGWWLAPQTSRVGGRAGFERTLSLVTGSEGASVPILTCSPGPIPPLAMVQDPKQVELGVGLFQAERKEKPPRGLTVTGGGVVGLMLSSPSSVLYLAVGID